MERPALARPGGTQSVGVVADEPHLSLGLSVGKVSGGASLAAHW